MLSLHQDFYAFELQHEEETRSSPLPSLQTLHMRPVCIPWSASIYRNLSVLDLRVPCVPTTSMKQLLQILRQCPDLESFRMHSSTLRSSSMSPSDAALVHLPKLATFHVEGLPPLQIADLLRHLVLPKTTRFVLATSETSEQPSHYPVLPADCTHLPGLSTLSEVEFVQLEAGTVVLTAHSAVLPDVPVLTLTVKVSNPGLAATSIASSMNVSDVETLALALPPGADFTSADPRLLLQDFARLRTLRLVGFASNSVRPVLTALRTPQARDVDCALLCPRLETLALLDVAPPCRLSTDVKWFCDERRRAECAVRRLETVAGVLSDACVEDLRAKDVEVVVRI
ncbi:hypothetical protein C8Q76DRAFT_620047 [Earliella scabrosa]|nr:hypothetical protein C8Q76DRAFT_620047 [Earliella scabrosa]